MNINNFIETVTNEHDKSLLVKKLRSGSKLVVSKNDSTYIKGRYIAGHGVYTVTEV